MTKYYVLAVVVTVIVLVIVFQDKIRGLFSKAAAAVNTQTTTPAAPAGPAAPAAPAGLNYDKLLKQGVNGAETKKLQEWLGVTRDGIFGPQTEAALLAKKGVEQITLNQYQQAADVNDNFAGDDDGFSSSNVGVMDTLSGFFFDWLS